MQTADIFVFRMRNEFAHTHVFMHTQNTLVAVMNISAKDNFPRAYLHSDLTSELRILARTLSTDVHVENILPQLV